MSKTRAKQAYLDYDKMLEKIADGILDAYDVVYTPDTKECYVISPDLTPWAMKSKVYVYDTTEQAVTELNSNTDTYIGQVVAILTDTGNYMGYMVNGSTGNYTVTPLNEIGTIDYNELGNKPIYQLEGSLVTPIILDQQENGIYKVSGQYRISDKLETIYSSQSGYLFLVEQDTNVSYIKVITPRKIEEFTVTSSDVTKTELVTVEYLENNKYATEDYVDNSITELAAKTFMRADADAYIEEFLKNGIGNDIIQEIVENKLSNEISSATSMDIDSLF